MKYHDFHLEGYAVTEFGNKITLHLVYDYPDTSKERSVIEFQGVVAYHFIHLGGTIITDIIENSITEIFKEVGDDLSKWDRQIGGLKFLEKDTATYEKTLISEGYKGWSISSAIGFEGFVIAKSVD